MLKLDQVTFGETYFDNINGVRGVATAKLERQSGVNSVCVEGIDTTGRSFVEWIEMDRLCELR